MSKNKSSIGTMILSLGIITAVAAALLAWVNDVTTAPIEEAKNAKKVAAIQDVTPAFTNDPTADADSITPEGESRPVVVFPAFNDGQFAGAAVETYTMDGFSGEITLMVGFDRTGTITGYTVLSHAETPGLGAKMGEWFRDDEGHRSVIGSNPATRSMYVAKDPGGEVDGITAATITSRAFLQAIRRAHSAFTQYCETQTTDDNEQ